MDGRLNHFDADGKAVMADVSAKEPTRRTAAAGGRISMNEAAYRAAEGGTAKKGDVLGVARVAGLMALKKTAELIPLCHNILIEKSAVEFTLLPEERAVEAVCIVTTHGKTGVEMEALTGVSAALLTVYDMLKALDKGMMISGIRLLSKEGGRGGDYTRKE